MGFYQKAPQVRFEGPYSSTRHQFIVIENHRLVIPSDASDGACTEEGAE